MGGQGSHRKIRSEAPIQDRTESRNFEGQLTRGLHGLVPQNEAGISSLGRYTKPDVDEDRATFNYPSIRHEAI